MAEVLTVSAPPTPSRRTATTGRVPLSFARLQVYLAPLLVTVAALAAAAYAYGQFLEAPRHLWGHCVHDRNAHYHFGLSVALALRQGDVVQLLHDFDGWRVWGPLHGLLEGMVLAVLGTDYRLAVLPSLVGWVGAALLGFLAARRAARSGGNFAGLVTAVFILGSPAHHAFATDIMLESLGACLSLLVLYLYLVAVQESTPWPGRLLGLALTALFLHKYNYWLLLVFSLAAAELSSHVSAYIRLLKDTLAGTDVRAWATAQLRQPLNYALAVALTLVAYVFVTGGGTLQVADQHISLTSPHNLVHLAYVLLFLRILQWWWSAGRAWARRLDLRQQQLLWWHAWPVAVWFLWPKRLSYCLWYLSPAQAGERPQFDRLGGFPMYFGWLQEDYHLGLWSLLLVFGLIGVAALTWRRLRPGASVLLWFLLIATVLTVQHPNRKSRFLHSWIAGAWVVAGVGLAQIAYGRLTARCVPLRPVLAAAGIASLGLAHLPAVLARGHAPEGGVQLDRASTLDLTDCYLPHLEASRQAAIFSNQPIKYLSRWTYLERYGRLGRLETEIKGYGTTPGDEAQAFGRWLQKTPCDTVVYVDLPPGSYFDVNVPLPGYEQLPRLIAAQQSFKLVRSYNLLEYGSSVTVWSREAQTAARR